MMRRLAAAATLVVLGVIGAAGPAAAIDLPDLPGIPGVPGLPDVPGLGTPSLGDLPGVECAADVPISSPNTGPANGIDPGPDTPRGGNPFGDTPETTMYEAYGYGGMSWHSIQGDCDLGDVIGDTAAHPGDSAAESIANLLLLGLSLAVSVVAFVLRLAFAPSTLSIFDPVLQLGVDATGNNVFLTLFWVTLAATGIYLIWNANSGRFKDSLHNAGWVLGAGLIGIVATTYPLVVAPTFDQALTNLVGSVNGAVADGAGAGDALGAADGAAANLHHALLYRTWCAGTVGRASGDTATEFCPQLFAASTFSREEWEQVQGDPDAVTELASQKQDAFNEVADNLKDTDPAAYEYLTGSHNVDRIGYALLGWVAFLCVAPFLLMAGILLLYALVVIRMAIIAAPAVAVIGGFPTFRRYLTGLFDYVAGALVTAAVFGVLAAVFVAMLGAFLSPTSTVNPWVSILLMLLATVAAWKFTQPWRKVKSLANIKKRFRGEYTDPEWRHTVDWKAAGAKAGGLFVAGSPRTEYADAAPAESRWAAATQGAMQGAAATAVAGAATGGGATVAGVTVGAVKGAVGGAAAAGGPEAAPRALPAGAPPDQATPPLYDPGTELPRETKTVWPTDDDGELVYAIFDMDQEANQ